jgi:hypothetical protein
MNSKQSNAVFAFHWKSLLALSKEAVSMISLE